MNIKANKSVKKLGNIVNIVMGQSPKGSSYNDKGVGVALINGPTEFTNKYPIRKQWTTEPTKICKKYDILLCVRGSSTGRMNISDGEYCIGRGVAAISPKKGIAHTEYVYYLLNFEVDRILKRAAGSTFPNVTGKELNELEVNVFPIPEQQKIATILETWDKAIELKEKLIQQKKEQKRGLMKKLLTGEVRLSGFHGEWKEIKLGTVLKERNETKFNNLELLAITSKNGVVRRTEVDIKDNSSKDKSKYKRICPLDIGYNTMRMWQGVSGVSKYEGIVSPAYTIIKPTEKVDSYFMAYLFQVPKVINLFWRYSQGLVSDTLNLKYSNLKKIKVTIPTDINEQRAIAKIFNTVDHNIELHEQELQALKLQKKGLMQLLLTGIVRVKV